MNPLASIARRPPPRCAPLALLALVAAGCPATPPPTPRDGGADAPRDATPDAPRCDAGDIVCDPSSGESRRCDGRGGFTDTVDCRSQGRTCVSGLGCALCRPTDRRCSPDAPLTTQVCSADGQAWTNDATCDESAGLRCSQGRCVDRCSELENAYLGCEYWPTVTPNSQLLPSFEFAVAVSNPQSYPVSVTVEGGALTAPRTVTITPGGVDTLTLPWVTALVQNGSTTCTLRADPASSAQRPGGAYHLRATAPVAAYQFNPLNYRTASAFSFSNDASLLLPTNALGQHYIVVSQPSDSLPHSDGRPATRGGFVAIVGAHAEGTAQVTLTLTSPVWNPSSPRTPLPAGEQRFSVTRGEVLLLVGAEPGGDLTGSIVRSDRPIAVFVGHDCATSPRGRTACDHLEEQLLPSQAWGSDYAVSQFRDRSATERSVVRIVSQRDGNRLAFDGIPAPAECTNTLDQGRFCEFETDGNFRVRGTLPILVTQFMHGLESNPACTVATCTAPPDLPECVGDPAMVFEVPIEQYRSAYTFLVPATYSRSYVNVTAPNGAAIELDGAAISATGVPTGTGYQTYFVELAAGAHTIRSRDGTTRFGLKVYGVASFTSYAYPGGLDLAPISPPG